MPWKGVLTLWNGFNDIWNQTNKAGNSKGPDDFHLGKKCRLNVSYRLLYSHPYVIYLLIYKYKLGFHLRGLYNERCSVTKEKSIVISHYVMVLPML